MWSSLTRAWSEMEAPLEECIIGPPMKPQCREADLVQPDVNMCLSTTGSGGSGGSGLGSPAREPWCHVRHMVVYGLGSPEDSRTSRYQVGESTRGGGRMPGACMKGMRVMRGRFIIWNTLSFLFPTLASSIPAPHPPLCD